MKKGEKSTDAGKKTENKYTEKINASHTQKLSDKIPDGYIR